MTAYYNEFDPYAAQWLRNLIDAGLIPHGDVDERSIVDVAPSDLAGYTQCHFFAGIGGWALAARLAGWPEEHELWTGSAPCQPFSVAGAQRGTDDERHLWPYLFRLIAARRPSVFFGEQVAAAAKPRDARQDLQKVRRSQALQRVLRGQEGPYAIKLLRMLEGIGASSESWYDLAAIGIPRGMEEEKSCAGLDWSSEASRDAEGVGVRLGPVDSSTGGTLCARSLRDDGIASEHGRREDLGQPIDRQNRPVGGLHDNERAGGSVRPERDDEHMGRGQGSGSGRCSAVEDAGSGSTSSRGVGSEPEVQAESSWLDGVFADLEGVGYACGAAVVPACAVDAPHRRDRLWFVGSRGGAMDHGKCARLEGHAGDVDGEAGRAKQDRPTAAPSDGRAVGNTDIACSGSGREQRSGQLGGAGGDPRACGGGDVADADGERGEVHPDAGGCAAGSGAREIAGPRSAWDGAGWIIGHDGKARRVEPGIRLLAHGVPARVGRLRAYGNAIVPQLAAEVIGAYMECA